MIISISVKCSDMFSMYTESLTGKLEYNGYVPDFFPGEHYGDYIELNIDTETGKITNWPRKLSDKRITKVFSSSNR